MKTWGSRVVHGCAAVGAAGGVPGMLEAALPLVVAGAVVVAVACGVAVAALVKVSAP